MIVALQSTGEIFFIFESLVLMLEDLSALKPSKVSGALHTNLTYIQMKQESLFLFPKMLITVSVCGFQIAF